MQKNLYLGVLLAPYRVDYYNYLHDHLNFEIFFQLKGFKGQLFDSNKLIELSTYTPQYIKGVGKEQRRICFGIRKLIKEYSPQIVIVPEFSLLTILVVAIKHIFGYNYKIVSQCDDSYQMLVSGGFSKIHDQARNLCIKYIDELILVDTRAVQWYQERYHKGIWMPIIKNERRNESDISLLKKHIEYYEDNYRQKGRNIILFVGRLVEVKNLSILLEACSHLKEDYHLLIVGDGPMRQQWQTMANKLNITCTFLGQKNDEELEAIYRIATVFVLPSKMEAFGAVTNEALLAGCYCCISSNAGSACLIENGVNGYLFNPNSSEELADKISHFLQKEKKGKSLMIHSFNTYMQELSLHFEKIS